MSIVWTPAMTPESQARLTRIACGMTAAALVTLVVAYFGIQRSMEIGRLAGPPWYDDVVYLFVSQELFHASANQPWTQTVLQLLNQHAPLSTALGTAGYWLFGGNADIGPYVMNVVVLFGFLCGCVVILRDCPVGVIVGLIGAIGAVPLASFSITEFRPDFAWGFLTGLAAVALQSRGVFSGGTARLIGTGLLAGLALVSKPSASPVTAVILSATFFGGSVLYVLDRRDVALRVHIRTILGRAAIVGLASCVIVGPIFAFIWRATYEYIRLALVELHDQNTIKGDLAFHALYYFSGDAGGLVLGWAAWACLALWLALIAHAALFDRKLLPRAAGFLAVVLVAYAIPSHTVVKSLHLGSAFYGVLIASSVAGAASLWRAATHAPIPRYALAAASLLIGVGGMALTVKANVLKTPFVLMQHAPDARRDYQEGTKQIWSILRDAERARSEPPTRTPFALVLAPEPITAGTISLYGAREGLALRGAGAYYARSVDVLVEQLKNYDYVVAGESIAYQLHGPRLGTEFLALMDARADFRQIGSYRRVDGTLVKIYGRTMPP